MLNKDQFPDVQSIGHISGAIYFPNEELFCIQVGVICNWFYKKKKTNFRSKASRKMTELCLINIT